MLKKTNGRLMLTSTAYSLGKKLVQIYLPAISGLYFGLGNIWSLPAIENVVGSLAVFATFIGVCLGLSSKQYDDSGAALIELADAQLANVDGEIEVETKNGKLVYTLAVNGDPEDIQNKELITFKVAPKS